MVPFSVLDLSPIVEGGDPGQALRNTLDLARHAERWGYRRYWLAEHHNMPGIASAATAVVLEVMSYFQPAKPGQQVQAVPGAGLDVPIWILGSSLYGAQLAAALGLPYAFASHFAPEQMMEAVRLYRAQFQPSDRQATPYAMVGLNVIAADSDEQAQFLFSSLQQATLNNRL